MKVRLLVLRGESPSKTAAEQLLRDSSFGEMSAERLIVLGLSSSCGLVLQVGGFAVNQAVRT
jgi:hypothetical protein